MPHQRPLIISCEFCGDQAKVALRGSIKKFCSRRCCFKAWQQANLEKCRLFHRDWMKQWRLENPELNRERKRLWYDTHGRKRFPCKKRCLFCHKWFQQVSVLQKYCCRRCEKRDWRKSHFGYARWPVGRQWPIKRKCLACGKNMKSHYYVADRKQYCNRRCKMMGWRRKNPERARFFENQYRTNNKERVALYHKLYIKEWVKRNRDRVNEYSIKHRARRRGASGSHTVEQWQEMKARYNYTCPACGKKGA